MSGPTPEIEGYGVVDPAAGRDPVPELDVHAALLRQAAMARGIATEAVMASRQGRRPKPYLKLRINGRQYFYRTGVLRRAAKDGSGTVGLHINSRAILLTADKGRTKEVLHAAGLSVAPGRVFRVTRSHQALTYALGLGRPVCIKPNRGQKSIATFPGLTDPDEISAAIRTVARQFDEVLVETHVTGEIVRYFYVQPSAIAAKISYLGHVVGNGRDTVGALVAALNQLRTERALRSHPPLAVDARVVDHLAKQGLTLASIPEDGRRVLLSLTSNRESGSVSVESWDRVHRSYAAEVEAASRALPGLKMAAIDLMVADPDKPAEPGNHWFLDVNSSPGLLPWQLPWAGRVQDVAGAVIDYLLRIPEPAA